MTRLLVDVGIALFAAVVAAALAFERTPLWDPPQQVLVLLVVLSAVIAAGATSYAAVQRYLSERWQRRLGVLDDLLTAAVWAVVDATGVDARDLSLAEYRVQKRWFRPPRLARYHRVRASRRPGASGVEWAPGKGVIGACVETGSVVTRDVRSDFERLGELDRAEWQALPNRERMGLSYEEYRRIRDAYDVVVAVPIVDDTEPVSRVRGCVAMDAPAGTMEVMGSQRVLDVLESLALVLQGLRGSPPAVVAQLVGEQDLLTSLRRLGIDEGRIAALTHHG